MAVEPSLTQEKKNPLLESSYSSGESSLTQGDSDSESYSVSSSIQGSISSAASSQYSSNVNEGAEPKKTLNKLNSKKYASFGSFMSSRRRAQSRLSESSVKLLDDSSTTPTHSSSPIEVSDESSSYVQKSTQKFTRAGSLRSVKIFRSKSKNKNKSSSKSKSSSIDKKSEISEESHLERATFSSTLKDSKFPEHLKHQAGPLETEEVIPEAKLCPYQHCSLHGHHHHHEPPEKRHAYLKRRTAKSMNPAIRTTDKRAGKKREPEVTKKVSDANDDFSIEFYAKTRSEPLSSYGHHDAESADMLFGVNSFQEKTFDPPMSNNRDLNYLNNNGNLDVSKTVVEKKSSSKKKNNISMWHMIHRHMVSGLEAESGSDTVVEQVAEEKKPLNKDFDDAASQETEIRKMFAIKLVRDAIEKILLPEVQDDQLTTSEIIPEQDLTETNQTVGEITSDQKEKTQEPPVAEDRSGMKTEKRAPKSWSYLKKVILLSKFVKELEKVKKFNPNKPTNLPLAPEVNPETVSLRRQRTGGKKNSDEWMLDYALQKVVGELAPTQKRKVAMLVKAFETVAPTQEDPQESRSNGDLKRVISETKGKLQEINESSIDSNVVAPSTEDPEKNKELKSDLEKEKHMKMWHMIYQHVVTDIATKIGSDLLLDGDESTNSEEKNLQEVEDHTERNYRLQFTQSDAVKLVRESVDEILLPEVPDTSSQDSQSVASDLDQDFVIDENNTPTTESDNVIDENTKQVPTVTRLLQQKSKNWSKLKNLILVKRSIKALEGFRNLKPQTPQQEILTSVQEEEKVDLRRQMMDERKKAEQWMLDYAMQHIVTKLTPARKKRVSMLVEAFEAVVPFPEI